ncbi:MAG: hypothetical protein ABIK44_05090 [candidate division WOR-3 bacterium]
MKMLYLIAGLVAFVQLGCQVPKPLNPVEIVVFDVGHGHSILVRTPDQHTCLIDGGPTFAGANEVCPVLDSLGITELDYCIATNYTPERIGGLDEIVRHLGGEEGILFRSLDRGSASPTDEFAEYVAAVGKRRTKIRLGQVIKLGELTITCCAVNGRVIGSKPVRVIAEQDKSIALLLSWGSFDMLIPSDLLGVATPFRPDLGTRLTDATDEIEVLVIGNFGSDKSVSYVMQEQADPVVSIISVGPNQDSLPSQRTINRLTRRDRRLYQTNTTGSDEIPRGRGRIVQGDIWIRVYPDFYTVAGDTFRTYR